METKKGIKRKFAIWKLGLNLILLILLGIILFQNSEPIAVNLLLWEPHIPLAFLLLGTALGGSLITFITVLIVGRN